MIPYYLIQLCQFSMKLLDVFHQLIINFLVSDESRVVTFFSTVRTKDKADFPSADFGVSM